MEKPYCINCKYFYMSMSQCRRFPPISVQENLFHVESYWPKVSDYNWCGEWKNKNEK